jgi:hypothetical protein
VTPLEQLQAALASLLNAYTAAVANPQPSYSVEGQSVSYSDYLTSLTSNIKATQELIALFDVTEKRTVAV